MAASRILDAVVGAINRTGSMPKVLLTGHTDAVGSMGYN